MLSGLLTIIRFLAFDSAQKRKRMRRKQRVEETIKKVCVMRRVNRLKVMPIDYLYQRFRGSSFLISFIFCISAFELQWESWVAVTETVCPTHLKIFTIWPSTEKVCQLLNYIILTRLSKRSHDISRLTTGLHTFLL